MRVATRPAHQVIHLGHRLVEIHPDGRVCLEGRQIPPPIGSRQNHPEDVVQNLSDIQLHVYIDAAMDMEDVDQWVETIVTNNRASIEASINHELNKIGCGGVPAGLGDQMNEVIEQAANESSMGIVRTYNTNLARQIQTIGQETPSANYRTYRSRLFGDTQNSVHAGMDNWATQYGLFKNIQIAVTETARSLNFGIQSFWANNRDQLVPKGRVLPIAATCPICQGGVAGNDYQTIDQAYRAGPWPAHVGCPHYVESVPGERPQDCDQIWRGG